MLHFLILKTSLDSLGLPNVQSRARGEGAQQLTLRRLVALNSSKQTQLLRSSEGQLLMFHMEQSVEQLSTLVTGLSV